MGNVRQDCRAYTTSVRKPERRNPLGRSWGRPVRWDNIKEDLKIIQLKNMDWINLDHERAQWLPVVNMVVNLPYA
jgi:hypothetical protein